MELGSRTIAMVCFPHRLPGSGSPPICTQVASSPAEDHRSLQRLPNVKRKCSCSHTGSPGAPAAGAPSWSLICHAPCCVCAMLLTSSSSKTCPPTAGVNSHPGREPPRYQAQVWKGGCLMYGPTTMDREKAEYHWSL